MLLKKKTRSDCKMKTAALLVIFFGIAFVVIGPIMWNNSNQLADTETKKMTGQLVPFEFDSQQPVEIQVGGIHVNMTLDQLSQGFNLSPLCLLRF
jgi:hypothetical protein